MPNISLENIFGWNEKNVLPYVLCNETNISLSWERKTLQGFNWSKVDT